MVQTTGEAMNAIMAEITPEFLDANPMMPAVVADNSAAKVFLLEAGVLDALVPDPGNDTVGTFFERQHHWGFGLYCGRQARPSDNGYLCAFLPKSNWTRDEATVWFAEAFQKADSGTISAKAVSIAPERN